MVRQGTGRVMNREPAKAYLGLGGINDRILVALIMTKNCRVSVIVVYSLVEPINGNGSNSNASYLQI